MSTAEAAAEGQTLRWYLKIGDTNHGPYTREEVARYLGEGRISAHSIMARSDSQDWRPACEDPELADLFVGGAKPPPHSAPARTILPRLRLGQDIPDIAWAHVAYGLYSSLLLGVTAPVLLIGVVIAHLQRQNSRGTWLESHYIWQIRTFWIALPVFLVGSLTMVFLVGFLLLSAAWLWVIYRAIKGWIRLSREEAIEDPTGIL